jgi:hypothetical protein
MTTLVVEGVDISHARLVDLTQLADQAKFFYDWLEARFQKHLTRNDSLDNMLRTASRPELRSAMQDCYAAEGGMNRPLLFDGIGRSYPHSKACYYMFA